MQVAPSKGAAPPPTLRARIAWLVAESAVALGVALLLVTIGSALTLDPKPRTAQVSILAQLQLPAAAVALVLVAALVTAGMLPRAAPLSKLAWAGVSGVFSGFVGGGIAAALHGARLPLNGAIGDSGALLAWAHSALDGSASTPPEYPPGPVWLLVTLSHALETGPELNLRLIQIVLTALVGPLAYLAWRAAVRPSVAAALALVCTVPFLDPYKPFASASLAVSPALFVGVVRLIARSDVLRRRKVILQGVLLGSLLGVVFLLYSGWYVWFLPGLVVVAVHAWLPTRRASSLIGVAAAGLAFLAVSGQYLLAVLTAPPISDTYHYPDTDTDPALFVWWLGDSPGSSVVHDPRLGALGGMDVLSVAAIVALGVAIAVGWRSWTVRTMVYVFGGAWILRFWYAGRMSDTGEVALYPRTSQVLLLALLVAVTVTATRVVDRAAAPAPSAPDASDSVDEAPAGAHRAALARRVGVLVACALIASSAGSATADRYLPRDDGSLGRLAWRAHDG